MNPRILLVEDDPTSRAFLRAATESLPAEVHCAGSIAEALPIATAGGHALWLIDARLPDGHGSTLLARLREVGLATPAIAHTASHEPHEHDALRAAGFAATIAKPLPAAEWVRVIAVTLARTAAREGRRLREPTPALLADAAAGTVHGAGRHEAAPVWDDAVALAALGGNAVNVAAMRALFLDELPGVRQAITAASVAGDAVAVGDSLHRLRAGCGFVGALRLEAAASQLRAAPLSATALANFKRALQDTLSST